MGVGLSGGVHIDCIRGTVAMRADDVREGRAVAAGAAAEMDRLGNDFLGSWDCAWAALLDLRGGSLVTAVGFADAGLRQAQGLGEAQTIGLNTGILAEVAILTGNPEQALALLEPAIPTCAEASGYAALAYLMSVHGRALAAAGRKVDAIEALRTAVSTAGELEDAWQHARAALALACLVAGQDDVAEHLAVARTCAAAVRSPWVAAVADHIEGLATTDPGLAAGP